MDQLCPCGSGDLYLDCCGRFIEAAQQPATPEQLMRSRYTAYALNNDAYILATWHSSTRPVSLHDKNQLPVKWVELKVLNSSQPAENDNRAIVEFTARFKVGGKAERMHEISEFKKEAGKWYYLQGKVD
ncbi:MAG: YchJ family protein [Thioalkalispiraceae bacterium]